MKDGIIRIAIANPEIKLGNPIENSQILAELAKTAAAEGASAVLFPELSVTGATAGELYLHKPMINAAKAGVLSFAEKTKKLNGIFAIGAPLLIEGGLYNCAVVINKGVVLGIIPKDRGEGVFKNAPKQSCEILFDGAPVPFGKDIIFTSSAVEGLSVSVAVGEGADFSPANICLNLAASFECIGREENTKAILKARSYEGACAVVYANAGAGESGTDFVFSGKALCYQCGKKL